MRHSRSWRRWWAAFGAVLVAALGFGGITGVAHAGTAGTLISADGTLPGSALAGQTWDSGGGTVCGHSYDTIVPTGTATVTVNGVTMASVPLENYGHSFCAVWSLPSISFAHVGTYAVTLA